MDKNNTIKNISSKIVILNGLIYKKKTASKKNFRNFFKKIFKKWENWRKLFIQISKKLLQKFIKIVLFFAIHR